MSNFGHKKRQQSRSLMERAACELTEYKVVTLEGKLMFASIHRRYRQDSELKLDVSEVQRTTARA